MRVHYSNPYLLNPGHRVSIDVIGIGGTGSQVITGLARMNHALQILGHAGLFVRAWDDDLVEVHNVGRQLFSPADIGQNKANVLITRINRAFGTEWLSVPQRYNPEVHGTSNILITCIDTAKGRVDISRELQKKLPKCEPFDLPMYWMDLGNLQASGQVCLGTIRPVPQPKSDAEVVGQLPNVVKRFPEIRKIKDEDTGPSCSLAEALGKQDLFINSIMAQFGCNLLWKLIREGKVAVAGCFVNLESLIVNPIKI